MSYTRLVSRCLFPLQERIKGHDTMRLLREYEESQWWPAERIEALQMQRLRDFLGSVAARVPYWRGLFASQGLSVRDFRTLSDLRRLPVIDKGLIRSQGARWRAEHAARQVAMSTSGSSGEPLRFEVGPRRVAADVAARWRALRWWGVDIGDREMVLWGSSIESGAQDRWRAARDRLFRSRLEPVTGLDDAGLDALLDRMLAFRPRILFGYPSVLARAAWRGLERNLPLRSIGVRVAITTSEVLQPVWRAAIAETFGCAVADEYGARDAGYIASECPAGRRHIAAEAVIVEVLDADGASLPPGEAGEIAVTNLAGPEFPFLRYLTGDRGALDPAPCECGRGLPLLRSVEGRSNDALIALDGARVHGSAFNYVLRELRGMRAYKIVQEARDRVEVLVSLEASLAVGDARRIERALKERLGAAVAVDIREVDAIPPEPNGKFRHIVCRIAPPVAESLAEARRC